MTLQPLTYRIGSGTYTGYVADGSGGRKVPGVLVAHEGGGYLTEHPKDRARRVAELGYVAFALDLFGDPRPPLDEARKIVQTVAQRSADIACACHDRIGIATTTVERRRLTHRCNRILLRGYDVLELARSGAEVAGTIGFHAGLATTAPAQRGVIRGKVLVCQGADDPIITAEHRSAFAAEMTNAGVDWQMHVYGGVGHSFTNPEIDSWNLPGFTYDARADRRSWQVMRSLLEESFG